MHFEYIVDTLYIYHHLLDDIVHFLYFVKTIVI